MKDSTTGRAQTIFLRLSLGAGTVWVRGVQGCGVTEMKVGLRVFYLLSGWTFPAGCPWVSSLIFLLSSYQEQALARPSGLQESQRRKSPCPPQPELTRGTTGLQKPRAQGGNPPPPVSSTLPSISAPRQASSVESQGQRERPGMVAGNHPTAAPSAAPLRGGKGCILVRILINGLLHPSPSPN